MLGLGHIVWLVHDELSTVGEGLEGDTTSGYTVDNQEGGSFSSIFSIAYNKASILSGKGHVIWSSESDTMGGLSEWSGNHPDGLVSTDR